MAKKTKIDDLRVYHLARHHSLFIDKFATDATDKYKKIIEHPDTQSYTLYEFMTEFNFSGAVSGTEGTIVIADTDGNIIEP